MISALSSTHLTISVYGGILGLAVICCKNEHASSVIDASNDPRESTVAVTSITLGFYSLSKLCMLSQVVPPASLLQVVSVYKGIISLFSELRAFPFFPIIFWTLLCILLCSSLLQFTNEVGVMIRKRWRGSFKCRKHIKYITLREMALQSDQNHHSLMITNQLIN